MTQHTTAPWQIDQVEPHIVYIVKRPSLFITVDCREDFSDAAANARLIVKSPEMYAMLKHLIQVDGDPMAESLDITRIAEAARALLREIEGQ